MNRIPQNLLESLIEHQGETASGTVSAVVVERLALDLREARKDALDYKFLLSAMVFLKAMGYPGADFMSPSKLVDDAKALGWKWSP